MAGLQVAGFSSLYHLTHKNVVEGAEFIRGTGLATHFSQVGLYCAGAAPLLLAMACRAKNRGAKFLWLSALVIPFAGILFTGLRAAVLGMVFCMLVVLFKWDFRRAPLYVISFLFVGFIAVSAIPVLQTSSHHMGKHITNIDDSAAARPRLAMQGLRLFAQNPVIGKGPNSFSRNFGGVGDAHNTYANILADYGLFGLIFFMWTIVIAVRASSKASDLQDYTELSTIGLGTLGCLAAVLAVAFFHSVNYIVTFWLFPAIGLSIRHLVALKQAPVEPEMSPYFEHLESFEPPLR